MAIKNTYRRLNRRKVRELLMHLCYMYWKWSYSTKGVQTGYIERDRASKGVQQGVLRRDGDGVC